MSPLMDIPEGLVETLQDRDPTAVNAIRSRSIHRKPSRSKAPKPKLQQLDATSFGAAVVALPSCHTSRIANFFSQRDDIKVDNVKDIDDDSVYSEASAPCEGRRIPSGPLSPLSMLFEGIMADCSTDVGLHGVCCDDSPYPYSPVSDSFVRSPDIPVFMPAEEDRGYLALQSEEYTSSPASSFLQTPHDSPLVEIETMLDQVLTHQITENAASDAASRASLQPLLAPEGSLLSIPGLSSPSSNGTSPTGSTGFNRPPRRNAILDPLCPEQRTKDVDSCRLTMPGGGPLLEPNEFDDSFEPFWSPFALESNRHTAEDNRSRTTEAMKANDSSPLRPPRPEHCRKKLENLGLITTTVPGEKGSPSLRSIRKAPADYLKTNRKPPAQSPQTNRRSGSTCSLDNIQMKDLSHFKLDPAPSKPRPIDTQGGSTDDRSSRLSGSTFVSAKSDVSIDTTTASSPTDATNVSRYPDKLVSEPVPARTNISTWSKGSHLQIYQLGEPMGIAKQDQALVRPRRPVHDSSVSRSSRLEHMESPFVMEGQTSLIGKVTKKLGLSSPKAVSAAGEPTDYSKVTKASAGLGAFDINASPYQVSATAHSVRRRPSLPSVTTTNINPNTTCPSPQINIVHTTSRNRSHSNASLRSPTRHTLSPAYTRSSSSLAHQNSRSRLISTTSKSCASAVRPNPLPSNSSSPPSTSVTRKRTYSRSSTDSNLTTHSMPTVHKFPPKSALKRRPSCSTTFGLDQKYSRRTIVDSATDCITTQHVRKVTFAGVQEQIIEPSTTDQVSVHNSNHNHAISINNQLLQNAFELDHEKNRSLDRQKE